MAEPDTGALGPHQQDRLRDWKIQTRISDETYLREHKEVYLLLSYFTRDVLLRRPDNIREFAADYFTNPSVADEIREKMRLNKEVAVGLVECNNQSI
ncbi:RIIa domain-containing protein 1 [Pelobates fuscus]|uniref:RIIa domain-containing protein 1 n=1 Tax=Pelobates fuscus TaxID=191477 RepID=UPI002FE44702